MHYSFLENAYNAMQEGLYAFDKDGKITHMNRAAQQFLGYSEDEIIGHIGHFLFHAHRDKKGLLECPLYKAFLQAESYLGEEVFITKEGKEFDVSLSTSPIFYEGKKIGGVVLFRDISEQKRVQKERDTLYSVVKFTEDIIVIKDLDLKIIATNNAFVKVSGHQNIEEIIGKTDAEIFGMCEDAEPIASYMRHERAAQKLPDGKSLLREEEIYLPDGSSKIFKVRKFPIYQEGKVFATANISMDITHEKKYAKKLENKIFSEQSKRFESDSFYNKIFSTANLGICLTDTDGRFVVVNPAYCDIYGYSESELIGSHFTMVVLDGNKEMMCKLHNDFLIHKIQELSREWEVVRKDGKKIHIFASAGILDNIVGGPYKITTISDITEAVEVRRIQKEQESILVQQSKLAAMGEMIGDIAHQWRQPLNVINCTTLDIKLKKDLHTLSDDALNNALLSIESLTEQMSETINDFMNFYKPNTQKKDFLLYESILFSSKIIVLQLKNANITLSINIDKNIFLFGSSSQLQQVILNLISNAKDAFEMQKIDNRQLCIFSRELDNTIELCIEDNAGGIKKEIHGKIFEPYFTTKENLNGFGIGLYMSSMIMKQNFGGSIKVENITNNNSVLGARFILAFPNKDEK